jgi:hypothetical protein
MKRPLTVLSGNTKPYEMEMQACVHVNREELLTGPYLVRPGYNPIASILFGIYA